MQGIGIKQITGVFLNRDILQKTGIFVNKGPHLVALGEERSGQIDANVTISPSNSNSHGIG